MNYYDARQLSDGSGWHYTSANRRSGTHPAGYCADHPGHATEDEARQCFRRYLLDGTREESYGDWTGCTICDTPTKKGLTERPPLGHGYPLCDEHRTSEQLAELVPAPGQIASSY
jgi:hypothetical protein